MPFDRACNMPTEAFERLGKQLELITAGCSDDQLLDLADGLHDMIRRRREVLRERSFAPAEHEVMTSGQRIS